MKIVSDDGKVFNTVDECNAYEADIALKKQEEEAKKAKECQARKEAKDEIDALAAELSKKVKKYNSLNNNYLYYITVNDELKLLDNQNNPCTDLFIKRYFGI